MMVVAVVEAAGLPRRGASGLFVLAVGPTFTDWRFFECRTAAGGEVIMSTWLRLVAGFIETHLAISNCSWPHVGAIGEVRSGSKTDDRAYLPE